MIIHRIFDTDHHWTPPQDTWTSRMPKARQNVAPQVIPDPTWGEVWSFEGGGFLHPFGLENTGGREPTGYSWKATYAGIDPAYWQPKARLKAMDADGVDVALLFPSLSMGLAQIQNDDLYLECAQIHNDGSWDWCQEGDPTRLIPAAVIPVGNVEAAIAELYRVAKKGFRHISHVGTVSGSPVPTAADEPFWAALQETGLVMSMHFTLTRVPKPSHAPAKATAATPAIRLRRQGVGGRGAGSGGTVGPLILSGVLERYPKLKVALIEASVGWLPSFFEQMDDVYLKHRSLGSTELPRLPSEYAPMMKYSFDRELQAMKYRHLVGVDTLMFGTDFPHIGSFWPHSRWYLDLVMNDVPQEEVDKILWSTAATFYGIH